MIGARVGGTTGARVGAGIGARVTGALVGAGTGTLPQTPLTLPPHSVHPTLVIQAMAELTRAYTPG